MHVTPSPSSPRSLAPELLRPALPPRCFVHLVSGPPGGGKSTHVAQYRKPADLVIDLDEIEAELSGLPLYQAERALWLVPALQERNRRLAALADVPAHRVAWVVACAPGSQWQWWRHTLRPTVVQPCRAGLNTCLDRIKADPRRRQNVQRHLDACMSWFEVEGAAVYRTLRRAAADEARGFGDW